VLKTDVPAPPKLLEGDVTNRAAELTINGSPQQLRAKPRAHTRVAAEVAIRLAPANAYVPIRTTQNFEGPNWPARQKPPAFCEHAHWSATNCICAQCQKNKPSNEASKKRSAHRRCGPSNPEEEGVPVFESGPQSRAGRGYEEESP